MRYLFRPEIDELLITSGLEVVEYAEWMTGNPPGFNSWGVVFVVKNQVA